MSKRIRCAIAALLLAVSACSDYATFVTSTSIGIKADANTEQAHIGYARVELFQGPAYPDVGDVPPVVGFLGSDLKIFEPHIRQLYATGDAARLVTTPKPLLDCGNDGKTSVNGQPTTCAEPTEVLAGERRPMVFGTGSSVGLNLGFTANAPTSIKFGYDREELSIIPFHRYAPATVPNSDNPDTTSDKYSSVLASIDLNVDAPSFLGSGLKLTQFFATGAAARNLAKRNDIRNFFGTTASKAVGSTFAPDPNSKCIRAWRGSPADPAKNKLINSAKPAGADIESFLDTLEYADERASFVKANRIPCP